MPNLIYTILFLILFVFILLFILLIFWIWVLLDCLQSKIPAMEKILWVIIIVLFNIFGAIIYLVLSNQRKKITKRFESKTLFRDKKNKIIAGVCSGLGNYLNIDPNLIRIIWIILTISTGLIGGALIYAASALILPEK